MIRMTHYTADISLYLRWTSHTSMWKANNLFIEGIPLCVDCLQVILKLLGAGAFGSGLYQTLAKRVDVLELRLQWINVVFLERLKPNGTSQHYYVVSAQITMGSVLFGGSSLNLLVCCPNSKKKERDFNAAAVLLDFFGKQPKLSD